MTDSLADVIAAVTVGQRLTAAAQSFGRSQSWRHALEKAQIHNEWIMQVSDASQRIASETAISRSEMPQRSTELSWRPSVNGPDSETRRTPHSVREPAARSRIRVGSSPAAPAGPTASALAWQGQTASRPVALTPNQVPSAKPAAPPTRLMFQSADPVPRSVHVFAANGQIQVVIRDEALKGALLPKLVARIRELMVGLGEELGKVVVNGSEVWSDPAKPGPPVDDKSVPTIEILF